MMMFRLYLPPPQPTNIAQKSLVCPGNKGGRDVSLPSITYIVIGMSGDNYPTLVFPVAVGGRMALGGGGTRAGPHQLELEEEPCNSH